MLGAETLDCLLLQTYWGCDGLTHPVVQLHFFPLPFKHNFLPAITPIDKKCLLTKQSWNPPMLKQQSWPPGDWNVLEKQVDKHKKCETATGWKLGRKWKHGRSVWTLRKPGFNCQAKKLISHAEMLWCFRHLSHFHSEALPTSHGLQSTADYWHL